MLNDYYDYYSSRLEIRLKNCLICPSQQLLIFSLVSPVNRSTETA